MRHLKPADYRVMPWRNGKGSTTEIAVHPPGSGLTGTPFLWRASIADVGESGPFSRFAGYDRTIMVIEGEDGMWLEGGPDGPIDLTRRFEPCRFSGDWEMTGRLVGRRLRDFNLMVARDRAAATFSLVRSPGPVTLAAPAVGHALLAVFEGKARLATGEAIATGDTLILDSGEIEQVSLISDEMGSATAAAIAIFPFGAA